MCAVSSVPAAVRRLVLLVLALCPLALRAQPVDTPNYSSTAEDIALAKIVLQDLAAHSQGESAPALLVRAARQLLGQPYVAGTQEGREERLRIYLTRTDCIDDAAAAVAWTFDNIAAYGGSPDKVFLSGHSAGGYLIDMLGLDKHWLAKYGVDADKMAAIVPYSGQMITHFTERAARGMSATQPLIDEMAPLYHIRPDAPPFLVITGGRDMELYRRYEENAYFVEMMKLVGHKDIILYEEDGFDHGGMAAPAHLLLMKYIKP